MNCINIGLTKDFLFSASLRETHAKQSRQCKSMQIHVHHVISHQCKCISRYTCRPRDCLLVKLFSFSMRLYAEQVFSGSATGLSWFRNVAFVRKGCQIHAQLICQKQSGRVKVNTTTTLFHHKCELKRRSTAYALLSVYAL